MGFEFLTRQEMLLRTVLRVGRSATGGFKQTSFRAMCSDEAFKPQRKATIETSDEANEFIHEFVNGHDIALFMKGIPEQPQCGFSQHVVRVLHASGKSFSSVNVLENDEIRQGIKDYSDWPTIPQLYVKGEFVGGCDIVTELYNSGDLQEIWKTVNTTFEFIIKCDLCVTVKYMGFT